MEDKSFNTVISALRAGSLSQDQVETLVGVIREQQARKRELNRCQFRRLGVGSKVKWNGRYGSSSGTLQRVMRKNAQIREDGTGMIWRVSLSLLQPGDE